MSIGSGTVAANYQVASSQAAPKTLCPTNVTTWATKTASKNMKAIVVASTASWVNGANTGGVITVSIAAPAEVKKRNAVVKLTGNAKPGNGPKG